MDYINIPSRASSVHRFSGKPMLGHRSNISEHTFEVMLYTHALLEYLGKEKIAEYKIDTYKTMCYAMSHDLPEIITSDLPYPIKSKNPTLKAMLNDIEKEIFKTEFMSLNKEYNDTIKLIVKFADTIAVTREILFEHTINPFFKDDIRNCISIFENVSREAYSKGLNINSLLIDGTINILNCLDNPNTENIINVIYNIKKLRLVL